LQIDLDTGSKSFILHGAGTQLPLSAMQIFKSHSGYFKLDFLFSKRNRMREPFLRFPHAVFLFLGRIAPKLQSGS